MKTLKEIMTALQRAIQGENEERHEDGRRLLKKATIRVFGQYSLFESSEIISQIQLAATRDVDALLRAEWWIQEKFETLLAQEDLEYDRLSAEAWIPPSSVFITIFDSPEVICEVICEVLKPIYVMLSKAIKAPEKNRFLLHQALEIFGDELEALIFKHGGDVEYFSDLEGEGS